MAPKNLNTALQALKGLVEALWPHSRFMRKNALQELRA